MNIKEKLQAMTKADRLKIAERMGITYMGLFKKMKGDSPFSESEKYFLNDIL